MDYQITVQSIKEYMAQLEPDQEAAIPEHVNRCLVANTIKWLYPDVSVVGVLHNNRWAVVRTVTGDRVDVRLEDEVTAAADRFDEFWKRQGTELVGRTRRELESLMPELFEV